MIEADKSINTHSKSNNIRYLQMRCYLNTDAKVKHRCFHQETDILDRSA